LILYSPRNSFSSLSLHAALPIYLPRHGHRVLAHELDVPRDLEVRDLPAAVLADVFGRGAGPLRQPDPRADLLAVLRVRHPEHLRSEEHTSELQSRENLVCRLLLE